MLARQLGVRTALTPGARSPCQSCRRPVSACSTRSRRREAAGHPGTITDLAGHLGGHPNTTRVHLAALVDEGLVDRVALDSGARGRPAHGHRLTDRGGLVLDAVRVARPVSTDELVSAMAEHLATTADPDLHARAIGRLWATQLLEEPGGPRKGAPRVSRLEARRTGRVTVDDRRLLPAARALG